MREIKFRAASAQAPEDVVRWIYGAYVKHLPYTPAPIANGPIPEDDYEYAIVHDGFSDWQMPRSLKATPIRPETVGEYTGLRDDNGREIYEGDVLECISFTYGNGETKTGNFLVQYHEMSAGFIAGPYMLGKIMDIRKCKVAGNKYENPELLEARNDD